MKSPFFSNSVIGMTGKDPKELKFTYKISPLRIISVRVPGRLNWLSNYLELRS